MLINLNKCGIIITKVVNFEDIYLAKNIIFQLYCYNKTICISKNTIISIFLPKHKKIVHLAKKIVHLAKKIVHFTTKIVIIVQNRTKSYIEIKNRTFW